MHVMHICQLPATNDVERDNVRAHRRATATAAGNAIVPARNLPPILLTPGFSYQPVYPSAPVAAAPESYEVAAQPAFAGAGYARPQDWNWTPVESVVPLAGRGKVRHYCPELREYYPAVETCPSPWLKVVP